MSWWETLHLVTWWKRLGISAIKTGQDDPSWIWCTERLSFFGGGHIVLQRFVHVRCHFQPLPTKLVFAYFDRGSYIYIYLQKIYTHQCITCKYIKKCIHISFIISHLVCQIWECKRRNQRSLQNHPWKSSCDAFNVQVTKCPDWKVGGGKLSADNSWRFVFEKISRL